MLFRLVDRGPWIAESGRHAADGLAFHGMRQTCTLRGLAQSSLYDLSVTEWGAASNVNARTHTELTVL